MITPVGEEDNTGNNLKDRPQSEELEQMQAMMDSLAHDLRNPLSVCQQYLALARSSHDDDHFDRVEESLNRIDTLIETRLESSHNRMSKQAVAETPLTEIVERAWVCVESPRASLSVTIENEPFTVRAENSHVCSVLENLFRNAIEHGDEDVCITVGTLSETRGFFVADDGPGIPDPAHDEIFDKGVSSGDGPGIGLSIVKMLSELYSWEINVTNSSDDGARFEFEIPAPA